MVLHIVASRGRHGSGSRGLAFGSRLPSAFVPPYWLRDECPGAPRTLSPGTGTAPRAIARAGDSTGKDPGRGGERGADPARGPLSGRRVRGGRRAGGRDDGRNSAGSSVDGADD